jgi:hypothetical protein
MHNSLIFFISEKFKFASFLFYQKICKVILSLLSINFIHFIARDNFFQLYYIVHQYNPRLNTQL